MRYSGRCVADGQLVGAVKEVISFVSICISLLLNAVLRLDLDLAVIGDAESYDAGSNGIGHTFILEIAASLKQGVISGNKSECSLNASGLFILFRCPALEVRSFAVVLFADIIVLDGTVVIDICRLIDPELSTLDLVLAGDVALGHINGSTVDVFKLGVGEVPLAVQVGKVSCSCSPTGRCGMHRGNGIRILYHKYARRAVYTNFCSDILFNGIHIKDNIAHYIFVIPLIILGTVNLAFFGLCEPCIRIIVSGVCPLAVFKKHSDFILIDPDLSRVFKIENYRLIRSLGDLQRGKVSVIIKKRVAVNIERHVLGERSYIKRVAENRNICVLSSKHIRHSREMSYRGIDHIISDVIGTHLIDDKIIASVILHQLYIRRERSKESCSIISRML